MIRRYLVFQNIAFKDVNRLLTDKRAFYALLLCVEVPGLANTTASNGPTYNEQLKARIWTTFSMSRTRRSVQIYTGRLGRPTVRNTLLARLDWGEKSTHVEQARPAEYRFRRECASIRLRDAGIPY